MNRGVVVGRVGVGGPARHLALDRAGHVLWTALGTKAARIAVVDVTRPARPRLLRRFAPPFLAHDVAFASAGPQVWVSSGDRRALVVYDSGSGKVLHRLASVSPPQHITFLGGLTQVTSGDDGALEVRSRRTGRVLRKVEIPVGSYNVDEGWGVLFTPSLERGTLCVLDAHGRLRRRVSVARSSHDACFVMAA